MACRDLPAIRAVQGKGQRTLPGRLPNLFRLICGLRTEKGRTVGDLAVNSISPRAADKIYRRLIEGDKLRKGEKSVEYCRKAWAVMGRLYPDILAKDVPNPWTGVTMKKRSRTVKPAVDRETVYRFAEMAIEKGRGECAAAAVICFEWLQRPENVVAGYFRWSDYSPPEHPGWVRIEHHKTGVVGWHPLEGESPETGEWISFYPEARSVLDRMPRRGDAIVLGPSGQQYSPTRFANIVRKLANDAGMLGFTLDTCRHGGLTELEEAGLTEGQGMALSMHRTVRSYQRARRMWRSALPISKRFDKQRKGRRRLASTRIEEVIA